VSHRATSLSELRALAADGLSCPTCGCVLVAVETRASGPHLRCHSREAHTFDAGIAAVAGFSARTGFPADPEVSFERRRELVSSSYPRERAELTRGVRS